MSWDVSICKFAQRYARVDEIPDDAPLLAVGSRADVHRAVLDVFPSTDWSDPQWGLWESEFGSIEFNLGGDDPPDGFMLHVRASEEVVAGILQLCDANGWQALDSGTGEFLEASADPSAGLAAWRAYRDRVIGSR